MAPLVSTDNNSITFTENQHGNVILENLRKQQELERCCDVILHVAGQQFHAHRCILSACSPFFNSIFKAGKTVKEQLTISCESYEVFNDLLLYIYSGIIQINSVNVAELLKLANKLHIMHLKDHCAEYLERYMSATNCLTVLEMSRKFNLVCLQKMACSFIRENLDGIINSKEMLYLTLPKLEDFIKSPHWTISNEDLLTIVTYWVYHNISNREINYRSLLTWISWKEIHPNAVTEHIKGHPLFSVSETCFSFILNALDDHQLLQDPAYESLSGLRDLGAQDIRTVEDSDKFLHLAISHAINEIKEDGTFLSKDKNFDSLSILTEANVDRYILEKDFQVRNDSLISQGISNFENDQIENHSNKKFQCSTSYSNCEKTNCYNNYCNEYCYCQNDICLPMNSTVETECQSNLTELYEKVSPRTVKQREPNDTLLALNSVDSECEPNLTQVYDKSSPRMGLSSPRMGLSGKQVEQNETLFIQNNDQEYQSNLSDLYDKVSSRVGGLLDKQRDQQSDLLFTENCCHYIHENSENCPTITNKKSYMSHKYKVNHPLNSTDENIYKKDFKTKRSPTFMDFNFNPNDNTERNDMNIEQLDRLERYIMTYNNTRVDSHSKGIIEIKNNEHLLTYVEDNRPVSQCSPRTTDEYYTSNQLDYYNKSQNSKNKSHLRETEIFNELNNKPKYIHESNISLINEESIDSPKEYCQVDRNDSINIINHDDNITGHNVNITTDYLTNNNVNIINDNVTLNSVNFHYERGDELLQHEQENQTAVLKETKNIDQIKICKQSVKQKVMQKYKSQGKEANTEVKESVCKDEVTNSKDRPKRKARTKRSLTKPANKKIEEDNSKPTTKLCDLCDKMFNLKKSYFPHMKEHFPGPPHVCDTCNSSFKRLYHLLDHRLTHTDIKLIKCTECSFTTRKMCNLKEHMLRHTNTKPLECGECGMKFSRRQHLINHFTKHTDERPFICETCGWTGKTKDSLLLHSKIHTGDMYSCQYSDCAYRTAKLSHLKEHMQYHMKSRPFTCDTCSMSFTTKSHLIRHKRIHETSNNYECPHCDYSSSRIDILKLHIKRKHSSTKQPGLLKLRKQQLKKKDAMINKTPNFYENTNQIRPSELSNQQFSIFTDLNENPNLCLGANMQQVSQASFSDFSVSDVASHTTCSFDTTVEEAVMMASEIREHNAISPYSKNHYSSLTGGSLTSCDDGVNLASCDSGGNLASCDDGGNLASCDTGGNLASYNSSGNLAPCDASGGLVMCESSGAQHQYSLQFKNSFMDNP